ncbi:hypothetical protein EMCRGX_G023069 [Ephydatia muelleri]
MTTCSTSYSEGSPSQSETRVHVSNRPHQPALGFKFPKRSFGVKKGQQSLLSEVKKVLQLVLVMPATNATSERSFSALRRVKTYLRTKMSQKRLNHLLILNVHKERTDTLDLKDTLNSFVEGSQHRAGLFSLF